ncbi:glycoside hydrolase family 18 protein [Ophiostoma piceae UAMH 11346]|uniref:chitinase n=1 Tax=Ophiostoma piceae (strain UAMH 11346) TaxID=1262450 RepID=S3D7X3_OPHP1|nr:glycoside hydrolase family 18 protein [Ophiostoma piceae UAMH 11346]
MLHSSSVLGAALAVLSFGLVAPGDARLLSPYNAGLRTPSSPSYRGRDNCPTSCSVSGSNPGNWSVYRDLDQFQLCNKAIFHQFNIYGEMDGPHTSTRIRACSSSINDFAALPDDTVSLLAATPAESVNVTYEIGWANGGQISKTSMKIVANQLKAFLTSGYSPKNHSTVIFGQYRSAAAGIYIGKDLSAVNVGTFAMNYLTENMDDMVIPAGTLGLQLCGTKFDADHTFGFMATSDRTYSAIQDAMQTWTNGTCVDFDDKSMTFTGEALLLSPLIDPTVDTSNTSKIASGNNTSNSTASQGHRRSLYHRSHRLFTRSDCDTVQVVSGDSCASLATKCGISGTDLTKYNPDSDFCATLAPGQHVCCSSGTLPDFAPKPNDNGTCSSYTVVADDSCSKLASEYSITNELLEKYNADTWGWNGCSNLMLGAVICLSSGTAPMPAEDPNAVCGPTVVGTVQPKEGVNISSLNPCILNACCDVWGQCGITSDFCTDTGTGAPGTAKSGTNGCISNCGTDIVKTDSNNFYSIAYYEGFNLGRNCLYQDHSQIDTSKYTHVHFSFATVSADYSTVSVGDVLGEYEFNAFTRLSGIKRILTFGGWAFSTEPATYMIFREGVTAANRVKLAKTIANFIIDHDLDGVDIDWEYPGAPDIPGIPAGGKDDGDNYLSFLVVLKNLLPGKSVSIAAPASYWYLKAFPIKKIGDIVDYVIYMTYDLHGQWDYGSAWAQEGCPNGNCLRSQVNLTETLTALSMVTKAGLDSNKVIVGVTSYGRSFNMASVGCYTPDCEFTGSASVSDATAGPCTNTSGYLGDAEIKAIVAGTSINKRSLSGRDEVTTSYVDKDSHSNILVYNGNQWVSWLDSDLLAERLTKYKSLSMGGTTNWAIDLEDFNDAPAGSASWAVFIENVKTGVDPSNPSGDTGSGNWSTLTCDDPAVDLSTDLTSAERWAELDAADFWAYAIDHWKTVDKPASKLTFSESIANSAHGPGNAVDCGTARGTSNCVTTIGCSLVTSNMSNAGSYQVWNSLVVIHEMHTDYIEAVTSASANVIGPELDSFEKTFAPVPPEKDDSWLDILLGAIGLVGTVSGSGFFTKFLTTLPYAIEKGLTSGKAGKIRDSAVEIITFGATLYKSLDGDGSEGWTADDQDTFSAYMGQITVAWQNTTEVMLKTLFDGSDDSIEKLSTLIDDGQLVTGGSGLLDLGDDNTLVSLETMMAKALFAYAIPAIWKEADMYPVVIDSGFDCSYGPTKNLVQASFLTEDVGNSSYSCYDGQMYFLVYPDGNSESSNFKAAVGIDALTDGAFGGLTLDELVAGAVRTYRQNGNQNGGDITSLSDDGSLSDLMNLDITTPGYVRIPVCGGYTAYTAWKNNHKDADNYPCNLPVSISDCESSTFVDQTSDASPSISDCQTLISNIDHTDGEWEIENVAHQQHQIAQAGSCKFGVQGNGGGIGGFNVGAKDIVDIISDSIRDYGGSGKVGAKGVMACNGISGRKVTVKWGLY